MCGRYNLTSSSSDIAKALGIAASIHSVPRYNIAPSQNIIAARIDDHGAMELVFLRWGLIPSWVKDVKTAQKPINAKAETLTERPYFRSAFKRRRCLIPANGFYEWRAINKAKQPYLFHLPHDELFFFAGLWERNIAPDGEVMESAVIITTDANANVARFHDRMPAIVGEADFATWLSLEHTDAHELRALLRPYGKDDLGATAVSKLVNSPRNDVKECVEPVDVLEED